MRYRENRVTPSVDWNIALFQKGQFNDAITELREALRLNPNLKFVRDLLVQAQGMER